MAWHIAVADIDNMAAAKENTIRGVMAAMAAAASIGGETWRHQRKRSIAGWQWRSSSKCGNIGAMA